MKLAVRQLLILCRVVQSSNISYAMCSASRGSYYADDSGKQLVSTQRTCLRGRANAAAKRCRRASSLQATRWPNASASARPKLFHH